MVSSVVLVLAMAAGQADITSTPEEFQEFGNLFVGRWSGEVTLITDWPGLSEKAGERLVTYGTRRWVSDKKGILGTGVGGETTGTSLFGYDAVAKHIWHRNVGSAGGNFDAILWKEGPSKWGWKLTGGGLADGKAFGGTGQYVFSEDGKSYVITGNLTIGGKPTAIPLNDTHIRLDQ